MDIWEECKRSGVHLFLGACMFFSTGCMTATMYSSTTKEDTHEFVTIPASAEVFRLPSSDEIQATISPEIAIPDSYRVYGAAHEPLHLKSSVYVAVLLDPLDEEVDWSKARFRLTNQGVWTLFGPSIVQFEEISDIDAGHLHWNDPTVSDAL